MQSQSFRVPPFSACGQAEVVCFAGACESGDASSLVDARTDAGVRADVGLDAHSSDDAAADASAGADASEDGGLIDGGSIDGWDPRLEANPHPLASAEGRRHAGRRRISGHPEYRLRPSIRASSTSVPTPLRYGTPSTADKIGSRRERDFALRAVHPSRWIERSQHSFRGRR